MAYKIYTPSEMAEKYPDIGLHNFVYNVIDLVNKPPEMDLAIDRTIQMTTHTQANVVAIFSSWFQSYFPNNYFKFTKITTQSAFTELREWFKDIYKKEKPYLVIDPQTPEPADDSIFSSTYLNRFNDEDPAVERYTARLNDALPLIDSDTYALIYRRNRMQMQFNIMIMEQSMARQQDTYNRLVMTMRHNSKFMIERMVPIPIPTKYITSISQLMGMDPRSDGFISYLNGVSRFPIRKELRNNREVVYFMVQPITCHIEVPSLPAKDTPDRSEAIEWGARITDTFLFTQDLPMEFLFLVRREDISKIANPLKIEEPVISFVSPLLADMDWPTEIGDYKLITKIDVELQEGDDPFVDILASVRDCDIIAHEEITKYIRSGRNISDMLIAKVYPNGSLRELGSKLHKNGVVELYSPKMNKLYTICVYLNRGIINLIRDGEFSSYIGTIETDKVGE